MPIIVLNMGGEMVYILHQRLQAQTVQDEKAKKVLQDVVRAMFSPLFIIELFKPQEMYSTASTKQIFEKLAHSSIMRLNKSSMEKLYDLMTMGFKYQMISCASPEQYLHVTLNHLESIKRILKSSSANGSTSGVDELVDVAIDRVVSVYSNMTKGEWYQLRLSIMRYLQGKKVKVSLFLQQGMQTMDGQLVLSTKGHMPYGAEVPGTVRYYDGNTLIKTRNLPLHDGSDVVGKGSDCLVLNQVFDPSSTLGLNLFSKDAVAQAKAGNQTNINLALSGLTKTYGASADGGTSTAAGAKFVGGSGSAAHSSGSKITQSSAKAEISMLADLLGVGGSDSKESADMEADGKAFKINLFPDSFGSDSKRGDDVILIDIDASVGSKSVESYMTELGLKESKGSADAKNDDDEDDLLAMMDAASSK